jgi:hypothetical protein
MLDQSMLTVVWPFSCVLRVRDRRAFDILPEPQSLEADLMGEELWYVKVADDDVHRMTLDQLDGAFQAGHIDESTMVLAADATEWARLGELLGLDDASEASEEPHAVEAAPLVANVAPAYVAPVPVVAAQPVMTRSAPVATMPMAAAPMARPISMAPPPAFVPNTLRPMSLDFEDGELDAPFRRSSRKGWIVGIIGVAAIAGGVGFAATRARAGSSDIASVAAAAAMAAPPRPAALPDPVVAPTPAPPAPAVAAPATPAANAGPAEASPMSPHFTDRFNEDQKLKLLAADKDHEAKAKARHGGGGGSASHGAPKSTKSTTFTTGGNKFDPLNSSI